MQADVSTDGGLEPAKPNRPKMTRAQVVERERQIWDRLVKGERPSELAKAYGVSRQMIHLISKRVADKLKEEALGNAHILKHRQLDAVKILQAELWQAWERSKGIKGRVKRVRRPGPAAQQGALAIEKVEEYTEQRIGDPGILDRLIRAMELEARLTGTLAPVKVAPTSPDGESPYEPETDDAKRERVRALMAEMLNIGSHPVIDVTPQPAGLNP